MADTQYFNNPDVPKTPDLDNNSNLLVPEVNISDRGDKDPNSISEVKNIVSDSTFEADLNASIIDTSKTDLSNTMPIEAIRPVSVGEEIKNSGRFEGIVNQLFSTE